MSHVTLVFQERGGSNVCATNLVCVRDMTVLQYIAVCCSVLPCGAACCSVLQCVAVCCRVLQGVAVCYSVLKCFAVFNFTVIFWRSSSQTSACVLQCVAVRVAVCCCVVQRVAVCCSVLQCVAVW